MLVQFCGVHSANPVARELSRFVEDEQTIQFSLHTLSSTYTNTPPQLDNTLLYTSANQPISVQLTYYDAEHDAVLFSTPSNVTEHGTVRVTPHGWLRYEPEQLYHGWDEIIVVLTETDVISGITIIAIAIL